MEVKTDLTEKLVSMEEKDRWYELDVKFEQLFAQTGVEKRQIETTEDPWGSVERSEEQAEGTEEVTKAPRIRKTGRKGIGGKGTKFCWTFSRRRNGSGGEELVVKVGGEGGHYELIKHSLERSLMAQGKNGYSVIPSLALVKVWPRYVNVGPAPPDILAYRVQRPVSGRGKSVRVDDYYDGIAGRTAKVYLEVNGACPLNEAQIVEMAYSLKGLDTIGPTKRGSLRIDGVRKVTLTADEIMALKT